MKKSLILSTALIALSLPFAVQAETAAAKPAAKVHEYKKPETRADAVKMAEEKLAELKKMTDAEWDAKRAKREERRGNMKEKLKNLTPEQRKALREKAKQN